MRRGFLNSSKTQKKPLYPEAEEVPNAHEANIPQRTKVETDSNTIDYSKSELIITTIPPTRDRDGNTEWIVTASTKEKVVGAPGFPRPLPKVSGPPSYVIRPTPDMGLGCFATRAIQVGDLVFAERPLLVSPRGFWLADSDEIAGKHGEQEARVRAWAEREKLFKMAAWRMTNEDRNALMALTNSHKDRGVGPIHGIVRTNAYSVTPLFDGPKLLANEGNTYSAVLKVGSRINHSCRPNIAFDFDVASFSFQFKAKRDIKAGEQLFYSYCGTDQPAAARKAELELHYGLVCKCLSCVNATPESDKFRTEYPKRVVEIGSQVMQWTSNPPAYLKRMLEIHQGLIDEGLQSTTTFVNSLQAISAMYKLMGQSDKQKEFADEFTRYNRSANLPKLFK